MELSNKFEKSVLKSNIILYRGTNKKELQNLLTNNYNKISWWSNNIRDSNHYYNGIYVELVIQIDRQKEQEYISQKSELTEGYTFGSAEMECPKDSIWYSISDKYMQDNLISVKEIFPIFIFDDNDDI